MLEYFFTKKGDYKPPLPRLKLLGLNLGYQSVRNDQALYQSCLYTTIAFRLGVEITP